MTGPDGGEGWSFDGTPPKRTLGVEAMAGRTDGKVSGLRYDEIWISDPEGRTPKKITDLDNEKGAMVWTPDSKALLYTAADRKLYSYSVADGKTAVVASSDLGRIGSVAVS